MRENSYHLRNEFASIEVSLDTGGNGPSLKLTDAKSGYSRLFDPVQLEAVLALPDGALLKLCDPGKLWIEDEMLTLS
jgi:hypothetical protein